MELDKGNLSVIRRNILNWYPWNKNSKILEINSGYGEIIAELCMKAEKVTVIEDELEKAKKIQERYQELQNLEIVSENIEEKLSNEKFDYIVINNIKQKSQTLDILLEFGKKFIKEDGTILVLVDNKFGLETFNCNWEDNIQEDAENIKMEKSNIEKIIKNNEFNNYKFYYPLPNFRMPNIIYTDMCMPNEESILRDLTIYDENTVVVTDERNKYKEIIKENIDLFPIYANSYLIEISNMPIENHIKCISFGNSRKIKYRMKTVMHKEYVSKKPVSEEGKQHLETIKSNIKILTESGIKILDTFEDDKIISKLVKEEPSFDKVLIKLTKEKQMETVEEYIDKFYNELKSKLEEAIDTDKTVFETYGIKIDPKIKDNLHFVKNGIYDLIFQNAFLINSEIYFYDQEWIEKNVPLEFILYRAIYYLGNSSNLIDKDALYNKFNIYDYKEIFEELENKLQYQIKDEYIWGIHATNFKTIKSIYDTCVHYNNLRGIAENQAEQYKAQFESIKSNQDKLLKEKDEKIKDLETQLTYVIGSKSWKITRPFRNLRKKLNKM